VAVGDKVHVEITVTGSCTGGNRGIDIFFVVDRSVTMFEEDYLDPTKDALIRFVNTMDFTKSQGGLITFASNDDVRANLTNNQDALIQAIRAIRLSQETDVRGLQGAFRTATQKLDDNGTPGNDKVIMILVAGPDTNQALINMPTVTQAARNAGMKVIFLMFPQSRYLHYVEAASDCTGTYCGRWTHRSGPMSKWAWGVDKENTADDVIERLKILADILLKEPTLTALEIDDGLSGFFDYVPGSANPPPTGGGGPDLNWSYTSVPPGGIHIAYDVEALDEGIFRTAVVTRLDLLLSTSERFVVALPNPEVTVLDPALITPTATATAPVTPTDPPTATHTLAPGTTEPPPATTQPPPATTEPPPATETPEGALFLPWAEKP
jgi:hypothetical protein